MGKGFFIFESMNVVLFDTLQGQFPLPLGLLHQDFIKYNDDFIPGFPKSQVFVSQYA